LSDRRAADLVLEGGGVKGIALAGAVAGLASAGYEFVRAAGSSAGAVVAALVAAGLSPERLDAVVGSLDYRRFRDRGRLDRVPVAGPALSLLLENGLYEGDYLREWLGNVLADLGVQTFGDLRADDPDADDGLPPYRLVVTATDVTAGALLRLPWDYQRVFGRDPDHQLVVDAVRASTSIPFVFEPVRLDGHTLLDGGVLSNFPIDTFDRRDGRSPRWPTFGVKLLTAQAADATRLLPGGWLPRPVRLLEALVTTLVVGHDQIRLADPCVRRRLVTVDAGDVSFVDFGLSSHQQETLWRNGRRGASDFLASWDWSAYLASACGARAGNELPG
jgi:NTE family protein